MVTSNSIGTNADGTAVLDGTSDSAIIVNSNGSAPATIQGNLIAADSAINAMTVRGGGATIAANQIGLSGVANSGGGIGLVVEGSSHVDPGKLDRERQRRRGSTSPRPPAPTLAANLIGVLGPVGDSGIAITPGRRHLEQNAIGSNDPDLANEFGDIGGGRDPGSSATARTRTRSSPTSAARPAASSSTSRERTAPATAPTGPNAGIEAPKVKELTAKAISGTGVPGATVWVYRSGSPKGDVPQELRKLIGTKTVKDDGTWKLKPGGNGVKKSWVVTANQNDVTGNGSEFAKGKQRKC